MLTDLEVNIIKKIQDGNKTVYRISKQLHKESPNIRHHVNKLEKFGIIKSRRISNKRQYSINKKDVFVNKELVMIANEKGIMLFAKHDSELQKFIKNKITNKKGK